MSKSNNPSPLVSVNFDVRISPLATEVFQTQTYRNDRARPIEAVYTFPVPVHSTLLGAEVEVDGRMLTLQVKPKAQATLDYEEAITDGKAAWSIDQSTPGLYTLNAGNLAPGQTATIKLRWALLNRWQGGRLSLRLPTTLTERYGNAAAVGLDGASTPEASIFADNRCALSVTTSASLAPFRWECPSHSVHTRDQDGCIVLFADNIAMDRDIVINLHRDAGMQNQCIIVNEPGQWTAIAQVSSPANEGAKARNLIMLIDCSGSMVGESIQQARRGAMSLLDWLRPEQSVNMILFGSHHQSALPGLSPATPSTVSTLQQRLLKMDADMGGTALGAALDHAINQAERSETPTDVLLLTDGAIWDTLGVLRKRKTSVRLFTVGVGFAANQETVNDIAKAGRGACEIVSPTEDMAEVMRRQYQRMCSGEPLSLIMQCPSAKHVWPKQAYLFSGDSAHVFLSGTGEPPSSIGINSHPEALALTLAAVARHEETLSSDTLIRLAQNERLFSMDDLAEKEALALRYQLVSDVTSMVIVDEDSQVMGETAETVPVEHMRVPSRLSAGFNRITEVQHMRVPSAPSANMCMVDLCHEPEAQYTDKDIRFYPEETAPPFDSVILALVNTSGLDGLTFSVLRNEGISPHVFMLLEGLTNDHTEKDIIIALIVALSRLDGWSTLPEAIKDYPTDDALLAKVLRIVRRNRSDFTTQGDPLLPPF